MVTVGRMMIVVICYVGLFLVFADGLLYFSQTPAVHQTVTYSRNMTSSVVCTLYVHDTTSVERDGIVCNVNSTYFYVDNYELLIRQNESVNTLVGEHALLIQCTKFDDLVSASLLVNVHTTSCLHSQTVCPPHNLISCEHLTVDDVCFSNALEFLVYENSSMIDVGSVMNDVIPRCSPSWSIRYSMYSYDPGVSISPGGVLSIDDAAVLYHEHRSVFYPSIRCYAESPTGKRTSHTRYVTVHINDVNNNAPLKFPSKETTNSYANVVKSGWEIGVCDPDISTTVDDYNITVTPECRHVLSLSLPRREEVQRNGRDQLACIGIITDISVVAGAEMPTVDCTVTFMDIGMQSWVTYSITKFPETQSNTKSAAHTYNHVLNKTPDHILNNTAAKYRNCITVADGRTGNYTLLSGMDAFGITPKHGIIYVSNTSALLRLGGKIKITANNMLSGMKTKLVFLIKQGQEPIMNCDMSCSSITTEKTCVSSCGVGAQHERCQWINSKKSQCVPNRRTCPDDRCDELEEMVPELCPCDCQRKHRHHLHNSTRLMIPVTQELISTDVLQCNSVCKLSLGLVITVVAFLLMVLFTWRIQHVHRKQRSGRKSRDLKRAESAISLSAIPSDYVFDHDTINFTTSSMSANQHLSTSFGSLNRWSPQFTGNTIAIDKKWEFPREKITLHKTLGEGEFGQVIKAHAHNIGSKPGITVVAVKMLKNGASSSELRDLVSEYNLLKEVSHPNVIKLMGACTQRGPFYLIVEYCLNGSLRSYLRGFRHNKSYPRIPGLTQRDLLSFCWQISKGMQYLTQLKVVHRDLASRNVLVAENKLLKISDFGLSRDVYEEETYFKKTKGRLPIKWMAPESLYDQVFTTKSDVWSFGVLMWEIVTLGANPYPGIPPERLYVILKNGHRMDKPTNCSHTLFQIISNCWQDNPHERPPFKELMHVFDNLLSTDINYLDIGHSNSHPILDECNNLSNDGYPEDLIYTLDNDIGYGNLNRMPTDNGDYLTPQIQCCNTNSPRQSKRFNQLTYGEVIPTHAQATAGEHHPNSSQSSRSCSISSQTRDVMCENTILLTAENECNEEIENKTNEEIDCSYPSENVNKTVDIVTIV